MLENAQKIFWGTLRKWSKTMKMIARSMRLSKVDSVMAKLGRAKPRKLKKNNVVIMTTRVPIKKFGSASKTFASGKRAMMTIKK